MIQIQWSSSSFEEAKQIAKALLEKKWIACATILPRVYALYWWKGELEEGEEVKVFLKTEERFYINVAHYIEAHASNQISEILKFEISEVNAPYLNWMKLNLEV